MAGTPRSHMRCSVCICTSFGSGRLPIQSHFEMQSHRYAHHAVVHSQNTACADVQWHMSLMHKAGCRGPSRLPDLSTCTQALALHLLCRQHIRASTTHCCSRHECNTRAALAAGADCRHIMVSDQIAVVASCSIKQPMQHNSLQ
jgi:hypothetical protein